MAKSWDTTGIAFSVESWKTILTALKPGGFIVSFAAPRLYHRMACAIEDAGVETYPPITWNFSSGMPKPQNVAKLFDRDNVPNRQPVGFRKAAGYNSLQIRHGQQDYSKLKFAIYEDNLSEESKQWQGYYYGVNALKPGFETIYLGRKPIAEQRVIDNIRCHGTGALNIAGLKARTDDGKWPSNVLWHPKARASDHKTDHPTVKPTELMEDLITLACPQNGAVLDPFGGTGTTGLACTNLGFASTLIEINPEMEAVMRRRCFL